MLLCALRGRGGAGSGCGIGRIPVPHEHQQWVSFLDSFGWLHFCGKNCFGSNEKGHTRENQRACTGILRDVPLTSLSPPRTCFCSHWCRAATICECTCSCVCVCFGSSRLFGSTPLKTGFLGDSSPLVCSLWARDGPAMARTEMGCQKGPVEMFFWLGNRFSFHQPWLHDCFPDKLENYTFMPRVRPHVMYS